MGSKRNANIEFARIIGCLIVVSLHICTWYISGDKILPNALLIRSFLNDGVPIFWYIMGYFLFSNPNASYKKRMLKTVKTLLLPAFGVMVFAQIWQDWVLAGWGKVNFFSCLDMHSFDAHNLFGNILRWSSDMTFGGHLWYVFSYVEVLLWVPLLKYICINDVKANKYRRYLMLLTVLFVIKRDISQITNIVINGQTYTITIPTVFSPTLLYVLLGYEVSLYKRQIKDNAKWLFWSGLVCYGGGNLAKYAISSYLMSISTSKTHFVGISSTFAYLASLGLFIAMLCLPIKPGSRFERVVLNLGSSTLGIYLIHTCVYRKLNALGLRKVIFSGVSEAENLPLEILCTIVYALIVFGVSYLLTMSYRAVKKKVVLQHLKTL